MKTNQLLTYLSVLHDQYGPPMDKTAEAQYFYRATEKARTVEALGRDLVKIASTLNAGPWDLAVRAARGIEGLQKIAGQPGPYQNVAQFYVDWSKDVEKRAQGLLGNVRALGGTIKSLATRPWTNTARMQVAAAGKKLPTGGAVQTFRGEQQRVKNITDIGGGSYGRGRKVLQAEKAEKATKAKAKTPAPAPQLATPTQTAPAPTQAAQPAVPAAAAAKPFISKGDLAVGGGLMGAGMLGSGYLGSQMAQPPEVPMDEMYY